MDQTSREVERVDSVQFSKVADDELGREWASPVCAHISYMDEERQHIDSG
jgi:hypothetical protein